MGCIKTIKAVSRLEIPQPERGILYFKFQPGPKVSFVFLNAAKQQEIQEGLEVLNCQIEETKMKGQWDLLYKSGKDTAKGIITCQPKALEDQQFQIWKISNSLFIQILNCMFSEMHEATRQQKRTFCHIKIHPSRLESSYSKKEDF